MLQGSFQAVPGVATFLGQPHIGHALVPAWAKSQDAGENRSLYPQSWRRKKINKEKVNKQDKDPKKLKASAVAEAVGQGRALCSWVAGT